MKFEKLNTVSDELKKYDYLAKEHDFIQVTEWSNGEGYSITINDSTYEFTLGQIEAINYLIKSLQFKED